MISARAKLASLSVALLSLVSLLTCTNASVYGVAGSGIEGPDRAQLQGVICAPVSSGPAFPVKVLFVVEGGPETIASASAITTALSAVAGQASVETLSFALEAFHTTGNALLPAFSDSTTFQAALLTYSGFQETGPVSLAEGLEVAANILSDDIQTSCAGALARTRYVIPVIFTEEDETCSNPIYNEVIDPSQCLGDAGANCESCRLSFDTLALRTLAANANVGEIDILPVYYYSGTEDPNAVDDANDIAMAAGSTALVIPDSALQMGLETLDYASLQSPLILKRIFAWNQNAIARDGNLEIDTDGDGLSDLDEVNLYGTDPLNYDTNGDGIGDGVEAFEGIAPADAGLVLQGCNPTLDSDGDRLNDCEEQLLGTDPCQFDTDGDGFSDFVEVYGRTNPLVPENTQDSDDDGFSNAVELATHSDPNSVDITFRQDHAYYTTFSPAPATADGRNCYSFQIGNVGLVQTQQLPNPPFGPIDAGTNNIFVFAQMGFEGRINGEVNLVTVVPIQYSAIAPFQTPASPVTLLDDGGGSGFLFVTGD